MSSCNSQNNLPHKFTRHRSGTGSVFARFLLVFQIPKTIEKPWREMWLGNQVEYYPGKNPLSPLLLFDHYFSLCPHSLHVSDLFFSGVFQVCCLLFYQFKSSIEGSLTHLYLTELPSQYPSALLIWGVMSRGLNQRSVPGVISC